MCDTRCGCWDGHAPFLSVREYCENFSEFTSMEGDTWSQCRLPYSWISTLCFYSHQASMACSLISPPTLTILNTASIYDPILNANIPITCSMQYCTVTSIFNTFCPIPRRCLFPLIARLGPSALFQVELDTRLQNPIPTRKVERW
jgi:hypothetical protein